MKAADEFSIFSPLLECKINKTDIRQISKFYHLKVWDKPASPCLSSRFPYGEKITHARLMMVENAENLLNAKGFNNVRVRYNMGNASIEVPQYEIKKLKSILSTEIKNELSEFGFNATNIDEEGFISGKLNRDIKQ